MTNEIKNKIRSYEKRKPITDKKLKFSNDLIKRAAYVGNGKLPDKRSDINTESFINKDKTIEMTEDQKTYLV